MKKALKELIENAEVKRVGEFRAFHTIPNGIYDGFWGKNGYDNILLLGQSVEDGKWYKIADEIDAIHFVYPPSLNWEINSKYGVPSFWSHTPIGIEYDGFTSTVFACERRTDDYYNMLSCAFDVLPTADVVERKRGKWITVFIDGLGFNGFEFECSECGKRSAGRTNYCAYCGADMKGENDAVF